MSQPSTFERIVGQPLEAFLELDHDQRAAATRAAVPDLHVFLEPASLEEAELPPRTRELARSLLAELAAGEPDPAAAALLRRRIVTDAFLRSEADRDQNVYLGALFTRTLTRAVPDLVFQPATGAEAARALRWARQHGVPVTLRGAASTAMGGSVPNDGGLTLDLARLDAIEIAAADRVVVVGAGARLRIVHRRLAEHGLALRSYPSNLGGTLAGWFVTGGLGLNAFGRGGALEAVRAADVVLPGGEQVRFHDDGRLDVPEGGGRRRTLAREESAAWFEGRQLRPMTLADLAGSEGVLGLVVALTVSVEERPAIGAFLLSFERESEALAAAEWAAAGGGFGPPANLKLLSGSHLHHVRQAWADDDARGGRDRPSAWSDGSGLPWTRIAGPRELGAACAGDLEHPGAYLFVDFLDLDPARRFAAALPGCPHRPRVLDAESVRFAAERFRPQQTKRLGPGLLAAEVVVPRAELGRYLARAAALARGAGNRLDAEVYYLTGGEALVIGAYLADHRRASFALDLMIAPVLLDLAVRGHRGRPYVLGRWQSPWVEGRFGRDGAGRLRALKRGLDPAGIVNRGVLLGLRLRGLAGAVAAAAFVPGVRALGAVYGSGALSALARGARALLDGLPGPAHGRGAPARIGAPFHAGPAGVELPEGNGAGPTASVPGAGARPGEPRLAGGPPESGATAALQAPEDRALHCVNCGECNSVCPIFHESRIRLPQMLTHLGEALRAGEAPPAAGSALLDLCMRCGNCEEVCQAGIPHLPLYQVLQRASDAARPRDRERHAAVVAAVRGSSRYQREFLGVRPGGYHRRSPASLPGLPRFVVLRAENDAGPASTCIHCGACVPVCPTHANRDYEGADPRWIVTAQERCIGCGSCVEVCPANHLNGGRTLRVVEAPGRDWFAALEDFERGGAR